MTDPWHATFTRRWHSNPDLCHTIDPVGYHSGRMGVLALQLFGETASRELLVACLTHDLGESKVGDVPHPAKRDPQLGDALDRLEEAALADMEMLFDINSPLDQRRLKYLDRLDAYLWAKHHAPNVMDGYGWPEQLAWLNAEWKEVKP